MVRAAAAFTLVFALFVLTEPIALGRTKNVERFHGLADGGMAHVDRVLDDGSLSLADGRTVRLIGILIPEETRWRQAAVAALTDLAASHDVQLWFDARRLDRYGHGLTQVVTADGTWLEGALVTQGLARVESFRDNHAMSGALLALEAKARDGGAGLWRDPRYKVMTAEDIAAAPRGHLNRFGIVEGTVASVSDRTNWTFVNFGSDWRTDFTIAISSGDRGAIRDGGLDIDALKGAHIRVRGWIRNWNGPLIEVDHAEQIERLGNPISTAGGLD